MKVHSILMILLVVLQFNCKAPNSLPDEAFTISNVTIIDPIDGNIGEHSVLINDGLIQNISKSGFSEKNKELDNIDATGKYIIPGLWDAHVHFDYDKPIAPYMLDLFSAYGIMYVRDTGGQIDIVKSWKDKAASQADRYPLVKIAGPLIDGIHNVYDGHKPAAPPLSVQTKDTTDIINIVKELVAKDVDLLKAYEMLTPEQFKCLMRLASENDLKVTGHVPLSMTVEQASDLGFNSMEHFRNIEISCSKDAQKLLEQRVSLLQNKDGVEGYVLRSNIHKAQRIHAIETNDPKTTDQVLDALKRNDTWQIPTLALYASMLERPYLTNKHWVKSFSYLPDSIRNSWKEKVTALVSKPPTESFMQQIEWYTSLFRKVHEKDIPYMAGTDCPIFYLTPGLSLHEELRHMVRCGMTPLEAIQAATVNPAKYFDMQDEIGRVREKYRADLILLTADPLDDITNTLEIDAVIKNGKLWSKSELAKNLVPK